MIRAALVAGLVCASTIAADAAHPLSPTGAETALIGLLDVPLVYDALETADAKPPTSPRIDIRDAPSATAPVVATVDREGLTTRDGTRCSWQREPQCRYHESGYEVPALAVFERRSVVATPAAAWYRVAIERDGRRFGWMQSDAPYHDLASLVATSERLTYLTPAWDGRLFDARLVPVARLLARAEQSVELARRPEEQEPCATGSRRTRALERHHCALGKRDPRVTGAVEQRRRESRDRRLVADARDARGRRQRPELGEQVALIESIAERLNDRDAIDAERARRDLGRLLSPHERARQHVRNAEIEACERGGDGGVLALAE